MLSERCNLSPIANLLVQVNPKTVLDVGVGFGNYGMIARAFLDVWPGRLEKHKWQAKIDGIEYYKELKNPVYDFVYNKVYFGDAIKILPTLEKYEAVILMHIVEHFEKEEALYFMKLAKAHCKKRIIIGTPSKFFKTGWERFPREAHKCLITALEFKNMGYQVITQGTLGTIAWKDL